jgi:hypothetical protein
MLEETSLRGVLFVLIAKYYNQIMKSMMGEECSTHERDEKYVQSFGRKTWKTHSEDLRVDERLLKWMLKNSVRYIDWINLAPDRDQWRALAERVMNFQVPRKKGENRAKMIKLC